MNDSQTNRELMWDYVYGLLSPEENQEMVARIKSDPQLARLYAEVRLQGELVAQAAIVEDQSLHLTVDSAKEQQEKVLPTSAVRTAAAGEKYRSSGWLTALAASALALVLAAGFLWPRPDERLLARNFMCADVVSPSSLPAGLTNQLAVHTYRVNASGDPGEGAAATVQLRLVDRAGKQQFEKSLRTNASGQATVDIPGGVLEPGAQLELLASADGAGVVNERLERKADAMNQKNSPSLAVTTALPVEPEPQIAYSLSAEPEVDAAKDVPVSTWNFAAFSAKPTPADEVDASNQENATQLAAAQSRDLQKTASEGARRNVQQIDARVAGRAIGGQLRAENGVNQEAAGQQIAQVVEAGQPLQVDISPELAGKSLDLAVQCRGVTVATTSEPAEATTASNTADRKGQIGQRQVTLSLPPEADGLMEVEVFDQASEESEPAQRALVFRQPLRRLQVELSEFRDHVAPGEEVAVKLRVMDETGKPAANARLGIRVWNERLVKQLGERPLLLADAVLNAATTDYGTPEAGKTETLALNTRGALNQTRRADLAQLKQQANRYQRAIVAPGGVPASGLDFQQPQVPESQQAVRPAIAANTKIELASNRDAVKIALRTAADEAEAGRQRVVRWLGIVAVAGGVLVFVLVGALAMLRMANHVRTLALPLITAMASLLIGTAWLGWLPERVTTQIAMAPATSRNATPAESKAITLDARPVPQAAAGNAPVTITDSPAASIAATPEAATPSMPVAPLPQVSVPRPAAAARNASAGLAGAGGPPAGGAVAGGMSASQALGGEKAKEAAADKLTEKKMEDKGNASQPASAMPPSLYFNPNLETDANGVATVRFAMPAGPSEYRLLIDALGQGRIGSREELIVAQ